MARSWEEIAADMQADGAPPDVQDKVRQDYFDQVVAPALTGTSARNPAKAFREFTIYNQTPYEKEFEASRAIVGRGRTAGERASDFGTYVGTGIRTIGTQARMGVNALTGDAAGYETAAADDQRIRDEADAASSPYVRAKKTQDAGLTRLAAQHPEWGVDPENVAIGGAITDPLRIVGENFATGGVGAGARIALRGGAALLRAGRAAKTLEAGAKAAPYVAGGGMEAGGGAQAGYANIMSMPPEKLVELNPAMANMPPEEFAAERQRMAMSDARKGTLAAMTAGAILPKFTDANLLRKVDEVTGAAPVRALTRSSLMTGAGKVGMEVGAEGLEEWSQQVATNTPLTDKNIFEGAGEAGALGMVGGAGQAAGVGALDLTARALKAVNPKLGVPDPTAQPPSATDLEGAAAVGDAAQAAPAAPPAPGLGAIAERGKTVQAAAQKALDEAKAAHADLPEGDPQLPMALERVKAAQRAVGEINKQVAGIENTRQKRELDAETAHLETPAEIADKINEVTSQIPTLAAAWQGLAKDEAGNPIPMPKEAAKFANLPVHQALPQLEQALAASTNAKAPSFAPVVAQLKQANMKQQALLTHLGEKLKALVPVTVAPPATPAAKPAGKGKGAAPVVAPAAAAPVAKSYPTIADKMADLDALQASGKGEGTPEFKEAFDAPIVPVAEAPAVKAEPEAKPPAVKGRTKPAAEAEAKPAEALKGRTRKDESKPAKKAEPVTAPAVKSGAPSKADKEAAKAPAKPAAPVAAQTDDALTALARRLGGEDVISVDESGKASIDIEKIKARSKARVKASIAGPRKWQGGHAAMLDPEQAKDIALAVTYYMQHGVRKLADVLRAVRAIFPDVSHSDVAVLRRAVLAKEGADSRKAAVGESARPAQQFDAKPVVGRFGGALSELVNWDKADAGIDPAPVPGTLGDLFSAYFGLNAGDMRSVLANFERLPPDIGLSEAIRSVSAAVDSATSSGFDVGAMRARVKDTLRANRDAQGDATARRAVAQARSHEVTRLSADLRSEDETIAALNVALKANSDSQFLKGELARHEKRKVELSAEVVRAKAALPAEPQVAAPALESALSEDERFILRAVSLLNDLKGFARFAAQQYPSMFEGDLAEKYIERVESGSVLRARVRTMLEEPTESGSTVGENLAEIADIVMTGYARDKSKWTESEGGLYDVPHDVASSSKQLAGHILDDLTAHFIDRGLSQEEAETAADAEVLARATANNNPYEFDREAFVHLIAFVQNRLPEGTVAMGDLQKTLAEHDLNAFLAYLPALYRALSASEDPSRFTELGVNTSTAGRSGESTAARAAKFAAMDEEAEAAKEQLHAELLSIRDGWGADNSALVAAIDKFNDSTREGASSRSELMKGIRAVRYAAKSVADAGLAEDLNDALDAASVVIDVSAPTSAQALRTVRIPTVLERTFKPANSSISELEKQGIATPVVSREARKNLNLTALAKVVRAAVGLGASEIAVDTKALRGTISAMIRGVATKDQTKIPEKLATASAQLRSITAHKERLFSELWVATLQRGATTLPGDERGAHSFVQTMGTVLAGTPVSFSERFKRRVDASFTKPGNIQAYDKNAKALTQTRGNIGAKSGFGVARASTVPLGADPVRQAFNTPVEFHEKLAAEERFEMPAALAKDDQKSGEAVALLDAHIAKLKVQLAALQLAEDVAVSVLKAAPGGIAGSINRFNAFAGSADIARTLEAPGRMLTRRSGVAKNSAERAAAGIDMIETEKQKSDESKSALATAINHAWVWALSSGRDATSTKSVETAIRLLDETIPGLSSQLATKVAGKAAVSVRDIAKDLTDHAVELRKRRAAIRTDFAEDVASISYMPTDEAARQDAVEAMATRGKDLPALSAEHLKVLISMKVGDSAFLRMVGETKGVAGSPQELYADIVRRLPDKGAMLRDIAELEKITDPIARAKFLASKGIEKGGQLGRAIDPEFRLTDESDVTAASKTAAEALVMADALRTAAAGMLLDALRLNDGDEALAAVNSAKEFGVWAKLYDGIADHYSAIVVDKVAPDARDDARKRLVDAGVYPVKANAENLGVGARRASVPAALRNEAALLEAQNAEGRDTRVRGTAAGAAEAASRQGRKAADAEFAQLVLAGKVVELLTHSTDVTEFSEEIRAMGREIKLSNLRPVTPEQAAKTPAAAVDGMIAESKRAIQEPLTAEDTNETRKATWPDLVSGDTVVYPGPAFVGGWAVVKNAKGEMFAALVRGMSKDGAQITKVAIDGRSDPYAATNLSGAMFKQLESAIRAAYQHIKDTDGDQAADDYAQAMAVREVESMFRSAQNERPPNALKTAAEARAVLVARIGSVAVNALEKSGKLKVVNSAAEIAKLEGKDLRKNEMDKGLYFGRPSDTAYLIAQNLTADNVYAVFLHELGSHLGWQSLLGAYKGDLVAALRAMPEYAAIAAELRKNGTDEARIDMEVFAHIVERQAYARDPSKLGFFQKIADAVRAMLMQFGFRAMVSPQDAMVLAEGAARTEAKTGKTPPDGGRQTEPMRAAGERQATTPYVASTPKQVRAQREAQLVEGEINAEALKGLSAVDAARYIHQQTPFGSAQWRLMGAVSKRIGDLVAAGVPIEVKVLGSKVPLPAIISAEKDGKPPRVIIRLTNHEAVDKGPYHMEGTGTSAQLAGREFMRAVILGSMMAGDGVATKAFGPVKVLLEHVQRHIEGRKFQEQRGGRALMTIEQQIIDKVKTAEHLLADGLFDPEVGAYLRSIPFQQTNVLKALKDRLFNLLGLGPKEANVYSALMVEGAKMVGVDAAAPMRSAGNTPLKPQEFAKKELDRTLDGLNTAGRGIRQFALGAMQMDHLAEVYGKQFPAVKKLWEAFSRVETEAAAHIEKGGEILGRWQKWQKQVGSATSRALNGLMLSATFSKTYIDRAYTNQAAFDLEHPWHGGSQSAWAQYQANRSRFMSDEIGPGGRAVYEAVAKYYHESNRELEAVCVDRVAASTSPGAERDREVRKVKHLFKQSKEGPYFPLNRFGNWVVDGKLSNGEPINMAFDSEREAIAARDEMASKGHPRPALFEISTAERSSFELTEPVLASIFKRMQTGDVKKDNEIKEQLRTVQRVSTREHGVLAKTMHRKYVEGASDEMLRGFAKSLYSNAHYIARTKYALQVSDAVNEMREVRQASKNDDTDRNLTTDVHEEVLKRYQMYLRAPSTSEFMARVADTANRVTSVWMLTSSISYPIVNAFQTATVTYPLLSADHNPASAFTALLGAAGDAAKVDLGPMVGALLHKMAPSFAEGALTDAAKALGYDEVNREMRASIANSKLATDEKRLLTTGLDDGHLDISLMVDAIGAMDPRSAVGGMVEKVSSALAVLPHHSEVLNRMMSALAAYRLQKAKIGSEKLASNYAWEVVRKSHYNYGELTRSRFMSSRNYEDPKVAALMRVMTQFQSFALNSSFRLGRAHYEAWVRRAIQESKGETPTDEQKADAANALKFLGMNAAVLLLVAGASGLPFANWLLRIINMMRDALHAITGDGEVAAANTKHDLQMVLAGEPGSAQSDMASTFMRGLPSAAGIDSSRMGFNGIIPGASDFSTGKDLTAMQALGANIATAFPLSGMISKFGLGATLAGQHRPMEALAAAAPKGISDAITYGVEGTKRTVSGKRTPSGEYSPMQRLFGVVGFRPSEDVAFSEQERYTAGVSQTQRAKQDALAQNLKIAVDDYVWAIEHDPENADDAMASIHDRGEEIGRYAVANPLFAGQVNAIISSAASLAVANKIRQEVPELSGANPKNVGAAVTGLEAGQALPSEVINDEE